MKNNELNRLLNYNDSNQRTDGSFLTNFQVQCNGNSKDVLIKVKEVLKIVFQQDEKEWLSIEEWRNTLPEWFVQCCAREISQEEAEQRLTLPLQERLRISKEEGWSLSAWIYWFNPDEKEWYWWESNIIDENTLILTVESVESPFPWGALEWLLLSSGAINVEEM